MRPRDRTGTSNPPPRRRRDVAGVGDNGPLSLLASLRWKLRSDGSWNGGKDVMVDLNFDRERPDVVLDLTRVLEIQEWEEENGRLRVGAGVTYTRIIAELRDELPGLAMASRTVGSPQIRNRG